MATPLSTAGQPSAVNTTTIVTLKPSKSTVIANQRSKSHSSSHGGREHSSSSRGQQRAAAKVLAAQTKHVDSTGRAGEAASSSSSSKAMIKIDIEQNRYPFCLVWTPLPFVTWFLPIIGHTGISNSRGLINDFSDDFSVAVDNFSFGSPTKFYQFDPSEIDLKAAQLSIVGDSQRNKLLEQPMDPNRVGVHVSASEWQGKSTHERQKLIWDRAISEASDYYKRHKYDLYFRNCHQYIACVLNKCNYGHAGDWSPNDVWWMITFMSSYTGALGFVRQWAPFVAILLAVIVLLVIIF